MQRLLGPVVEYLFELLIVTIATLFAYDISRIVEHTGVMRKRLLLIAVPLLVTGTFWFPGSTHLPATALSLLAYALFLRKKMLFVGFRHILDFAKTVPTLIVDGSFAHLDKAPDWWPRDAQKQIIIENSNNFVTAGESMIKTQYSCKKLENIRICNSAAK